MDHFFDDYFLVEPAKTIDSATFCFRRLMQLMGLKLDPGKSQPPNEIWCALGVHLDFSALMSSSKLIVRPKPTRVFNAVTELVQVLKDNRLVPSHAARLFGKLDFLNTTLFGKVGRSGLYQVKKRQHCSDSIHRWGLDENLKGALVWLIELVSSAPPRELRVGSSPPCALLYTDGSSEPGRVPQHIVGAVLYLPGQESPRYTWTAVPDEVVEKWIPSGNYIQLVELFAGPLSLDTWEKQLTDTDLIHMVDNNTALSVLVKNYSTNEDCVKIASDFWLRAAKIRCNPWVDRVESDSNISDDPSRQNVKGLMSEIGAVFDEPVLSYLSSPVPSRSPADWFGNAAHRRALLLSLAAKNPHPPHPS